jgi:lipid II:glycine glycyltransferase (peptidoglycan interpeptide bridge formation enzyme)
MPVSLTLEKLPPEEYESLVSSLPQDVYVPFEQSTAWARIQMPGDARTHYGFFAFREGSDLMALASIFHSNRPGRESLVMLNAPVFTAERTPEREQALVIALAERAAADPALNLTYLRMNLEHPGSVKGAVRSFDRGGFEREIVVDLQKTPDELKKSFSSNAKTRINKSVRAGVEIREITENRPEAFAAICFPIMEETAQRDSFDLLPLPVYQSTLTDAGEHTRLYVAYAPRTAEDPADTEDKIPVAWMMTNEYHFRGCYYYGGSNHRAQESSAMFALMFHILQQLSATGNIKAGLTGIASERFPELKGVEAFKSRFSKQVVDYPRLFDVPVNRTRYAVISRLIVARRELPTLARTAVSSARSLARKAVSAIKSPAKAQDTNS